MSPIDSILGLPGVAIERVERKRSIRVWVKPVARPPCIYCQGSSLRIKATHRRTLKHTRQANQVMLLHMAVPKYHCTDCNRYFRHRFEGIRPRLRATEAYRLEVFEAHCVFRPIVTSRSGIVTADSGIVTGRSGIVTEAVLEG